MGRLGVTPTIQTSKEFEGIASLEEVTDGTFGAPTVKLGAYMLQDPEPEIGNGMGYPWIFTGFLVINM